MTILMRIRNAARALRAHPSVYSPEIINIFGGGRETVSGKAVSDGTALESTAVLCAIRNISEPIAAMPLNLMRRETVEGRNVREAAREMRLYDLMHSAPNPHMTSFEFRDWMQSSLLIRGNAYAQIDYNGGGEIEAIWPLIARDVWVTKINGNLFYNVYIDNARYTLSSREVLHIRGFYAGGLVGMSLVDKAREAIGGALAADQYAGAMFGNGAAIGGVIKRPWESGVLSADAEKNFIAAFTQRQGGLNNAHKIMMLQEGMEFVQTALSPEDAQMVETRKFNITEVARVFNIPPHRLMELTNATFSNIEHQGIEYLQFTLGPWIARWQQRLDKDLLTDTERRNGLYFNINPAGLLKTDIQARFAAYAVGRQWGWLSADDIRDLEDMNPLPDKQGNLYLTPLNMVPSSQLLAAPAPGTGAGRQAPNAATTARLAEHWRTVIMDAMQRLTNRECADIRRAAHKFLDARDAAGFGEWLTQYRTDAAGAANKVVAPVLWAYAETVRDAAWLGFEGDPPDIQALARDYIAAYIEGRVSNTMTALELAGSDLDAIDACLDGWTAHRAEAEASEESAGLGVSITRYLCQTLGIRE